MLPTLNIILYTDHPELFHEDPFNVEGGLRDLQAFITEKTKQFVKVKFELCTRHGADSVTGVELHGEKMITDQLLQNAHELWVFGHRMASSEERPHNELEPIEIAILEKLMGPERRLGVFVTGDHSESPDRLSCEEDHEPYLSLGRALGKGVPLAGLLRDWEGPPSNCMEVDFMNRDNFNTQEPGATTDLDTEFLENDEIPQTLVPNETKPHSLFLYVDSNGELKEIKHLPDHPHEGIVLGPEDLKGKWPDGLPLPVVAARGTDKRVRKERTSNLVVAFDGDLADSGRIVVDSSFHHYLDENLKKIPSRNAASKLPDPDSPLDQIAQYFGNLALWLAPKPIRDKIKMDILLSLARQQIVLETLTLSDQRLGSVARHVLNTHIGPSRLQWLFGTSPFEQRESVDEFFSVLFLSDEKSFPFSPMISLDQFVGTVIRISNRFVEKFQIADVTRITNHKELWRPLFANLGLALESAKDELSREVPPSGAASNQLVTNKDVKGESEMALRCRGKWRSFVNEERDDVIDVQFIDIDGKIRGKHIRGIGEIDFEGQCTEGPHHIRLMTRENFEYDGDIYGAGNLQIAVGKRFRLDEKGKRKRENGDEVWVGVKSGD